MGMKMGRAVPAPPGNTMARAQRDPASVCQQSPSASCSGSAQRWQDPASGVWGRLGHREGQAWRAAHPPHQEPVVWLLWGCLGLTATP